MLGIETSALRGSTGRAYFISDSDLSASLNQSFFNESLTLEEGQTEVGHKGILLFLMALHHDRLIDVAFDAHNVVLEPRQSGRWSLAYLNC